MNEEKPIERASEDVQEAVTHSEAPQHADERTIRRTAEHQQGGMSTEEMHARYDEGRHPGGLHEQATKPPEDLGEGRLRESPHAHPYDDEPPDPKLRRPGHGRSMSSKRAGA